MCPSAPPASSTESVEVIIIGTGFSGIGMAIRLQRAGIKSFVLLERHPTAIGGTWRDNTYPGAACDIPSHLYCFSFRPNPRFSRVYAPQPEIWAYLEDCVDAYRLRGAIRFGADVRRTAWDDAAARWTVQAADGRRFVGQFLVLAAGPLKDPAWPNLPGLDSFAGTLVHSARWPWRDDSGSGSSSSKSGGGAGSGGSSCGSGSVEALRGRRVAVIGTGASAIQIIPGLAAVASELHVLQRTPAWVAPREDRAYSGWEKAAFAYVPGLLRLVRFLQWAAHEVRYPLLFGATPFRKGFSQNIERQLRAYIKQQLPGRPALAAALAPRYAPGCKRMLVSNDFYPAMARPNVQLHTQQIQEVTPSGVRFADGSSIDDLDAIICCTGFTVSSPLANLELTGQGGVSLEDEWAGRPRAWLGVSAPRFPNMYFILGPNTGLGHNSVILMAEAQIAYAAAAIAAARAGGPRAWLAVRQEQLDAFVKEVDGAHAQQVWASGCRSWYLNDRGENFSLWPGSTVSYCWRLRLFDHESYTQGEGCG